MQLFCFMEKKEGNIAKSVRILLLIVFFVFANRISAQFLGTSTNYSGSRGLAVNPSLMTTSFVYADFGLNLGFMAYNDFAYLHASDYIKILTGAESTSDYYVNGKKYNFGFVVNTNPKNVYETIDVNVISTMFNPNGKMAFGFFVNNRLYTNGTRIPWEIPEASLITLEEGDYLNKNYKSENSKIGLMAWSEVGFSFATTVFDRYSDKFDIGITAKGLVGYVGVDINLDEVDKDIIDKNNINIHKLDMFAAMAAPVDYNAKFVDGTIFNQNELVNGYGVGFDIGVTYTYKKDDKTYPASRRPCLSRKIGYVWRLGASLLDVGAIDFNKNAKVFKLYSDTDKNFDVSELEGVKDFNEMMDRLSGMFYDDPKDAYDGNSFLMGLPTAMSVQFDYNFYRDFYVNATWIQPIRMFKYSARRPAQLAVSPRFETAYFDFSLPLTLFNYEKVFVGAAARLGILTVGTQNIFNLIGIGESYGLDFYVAVKLNFIKGKCFRNVVKDSCWNANFR